MDELEAEAPPPIVKLDVDEPVGEYTETPQMATKKIKKSKKN